MTEARLPSARRSRGGWSGNGRSSGAGLILLAVCVVVLPASCSRPAGPTNAPLFTAGSLGATLGKFQHPRALAVDRRSGRFYVADRSGRIQLFEAGGTPILEWRIPEFAKGQPVGLEVEEDGNLLVNDSHYQRILRYSPDGSRIISSWGSEGKGPGQFTYGRDVVVDSAGFIYAGDYGGLNDRVQKFSRSGEFILEWGGCGEEPGKFQRPQGMAIERRGASSGPPPQGAPSGGVEGGELPSKGVIAVEGGELPEERILVADCANHRVQRFTLDGRFVSCFGTLGSGPGEMRYPNGVAAGEDGSIYVSEWGNNRVQRFTPDGRPAGVWGSPGRAEGELSTPWEVAVGPAGRIYVADYGNHRVQAFQWPGAPVAVLDPRPRFGGSGKAKGVTAAEDRVAAKR